MSELSFLSNRAGVHVNQSLCLFPGANLQSLGGLLKQSVLFWRVIAPNFHLITLVLAADSLEATS
jgi:hypothetical protein